MKRALLILGLLALAGGYWYTRAQPQVTAQWRVQLNTHVQALKQQVRERAALFAPAQPETKRSASAHRGQPDPASDFEMPEPGSPNTVTLYLTNGGVVTGELIRQSETAVTLRWTYGEADFQRSEIRRLLTAAEVQTAQ